MLSCFRLTPPSMTREKPNIPDWAFRERQADFAWIQKNLDVFWTVTTTALENAGRGTIVVDTTLEPIPGAGNPFAAGCFLPTFSPCRFSAKMVHSRRWRNGNSSE
jgi:hypothetical protein